MKLSLKLPQSRHSFCCGSCMEIKEPVVFPFLRLRWQRRRSPVPVGISVYQYWGSETSNRKVFQCWPNEGTRRNPLRQRWRRRWRRSALRSHGCHVFISRQSCSSESWDKEGPKPQFSAVLPTNNIDQNKNITSQGKARQNYSGPGYMLLLPAAPSVERYSHHRFFQLLSSPTVAPPSERQTTDKILPTQ